MTTWLSRIMAAVFTLNVLAPVDLLAQTAPAASAAPKVNAQKVEQSVQEQYEQYQIAVQEEYSNANNVFELYAALKKLHDPAVQRPLFGEKVDLSKMMKERASIPQKFLPDTSMINPKYIAYIRTKDFIENQQEQKNAEALLKRIVSAQEPWENLMLYLDPIPGQPDSLMASIVVAEIMGNTVDSDMVDDGMDLLELQLRAIFRLRALEQQENTPPSHREEYPLLIRRPGDLIRIQAIGTLRMMLLKVNEYYQRSGQENPLFERMKQQVRIPAKPKRAPRKMYTDMVVPISINIPGTQSATAEKQLFSPAMYENMMSQFMTKLREMKAKEFKPGSDDYEKMSLWAEFAVSYAMLYNPNRLVDIVKMFDGGSKATDFEQTYTTLLSVIFQAMRENLQYAPIKGTSSSVLALLPQFSDPQKYSIPTRIFALEAASILYRQYGDKERMAYVQSFQAENELFQVWCNSFTPDIQTQVLMAARAVDLYDSLTRVRYETYGLDSKQMQELSNKLAKIYNGFANADLKMSLPAGEKYSYNVAYSMSGKLLVANASNEIPRLSDSLSSPQQFQVPDGSLKNIAGLGRKSDGIWIEMYMQNAENPYKVKRDTDLKILTFIGEVVLWVWGGEILSLVGRAFRVTRGATLALPKAFSAASTAQKGRRMLAFSVEVQKGARMAQLPGKLARNGVTMVYGRVPRVTGPKANTTALQEAGATVTAAPKPLYSAARSSAQLKNKYQWWNPKRWIGMERGPITEIQFTQVNPGFEITAGRMNVPFGSNLSMRGIRTYDDWRRVRGGLRLFDAPEAPARINFYDFLGRKQLQQEMRLMNWAQSSINAGAFKSFDMWIPYRSGNGFTITSQGYWKVVPGKTPPFLADVPVSEFLSSNVVFAPQPKLFPVAPQEGIFMSVQDVITKNWASSVAQHYFKAVEWKNPVMRWLMPKYVPSKAFLSNAIRDPFHFGRIAGSRALMSTRFVPGVMGNTVIFGSWMGLDRLSNYYMQPWIEDTAEEEVEKAKKQFGDAYDPERTKEDEAAANEMLERLQEQGFVPPPSSVLNDVRAAQDPSPDGALFVFPFLAARQGLSKTRLGHWIGITTPFMNSGTRAQLEIGANRIQLQRWIRKYQDAKTQKDLESFYNEVMSSIKLVEDDYAQAFKQLLQQDPNNPAWKQGQKKVNTLISSFKKSFGQILRREGDIAAKFKDMNDAVVQFTAQREQLDKELAPTQSAHSEDALFQQVISILNVEWNANKTTCLEEGYDKTQPQLIEQLDKVYNTAISEVRAIQRKNIPSEQKMTEIGTCLRTMHEAVAVILPQQTQEEQPIQQAASLSKENLRIIMLQELDSSVVAAKEFGVDASALVTEWKARVEDCYAKATTSQEFIDALTILNAEMDKKWEALFTVSSSSVQEEAEPDNSELYPDVTTY